MVSREADGSGTPRLDPDSCLAVSYCCLSRGCLDVGNMVTVLSAVQILGERPRYLYFDINLK